MSQFVYKNDMLKLQDTAADTWKLVKGCRLTAISNALGEHGGDGINLYGQRVEIFEKKLLLGHHGQSAQARAEPQSGN